MIEGFVGNDEQVNIRLRCFDGKNIPYGGVVTY